MLCAPFETKRQLKCGTTRLTKGGKRSTHRPLDGSAGVERSGVCVENDLENQDTHVDRLSREMSSAANLFVRWRLVVCIRHTVVLCEYVMVVFVF